MSQSKKLTYKGTFRQVFIKDNPPPLSCVNKYTVYTYTVCVGVGVQGSSGPRTDKHIYLYDDILLWCLLSI